MYLKITNFGYGKKQQSKASKRQLYFFNIFKKNSTLYFHSVYDLKTPEGG